MKIGLLTVHCSKNPGASLQAHALAKKLAELGGEVEVINYCPSFFLDPMDPEKRKLWSFKDKVKALLIGKKQQERYMLFQKFNTDNLPGLSKRYNTPSELGSAEEKYDIYVCGSDQIWNPEHVMHDSSFFFDYVDKETAVLASYAASIGHDNVGDSDKKWILEGLKHLDCISIREKAGTELAKELMKSEDIVQSIDPTLFYPGSYWKGMSKRPDIKLPEHYILYYPIQNTEFSYEMIADLKKTTDLPCVALDGGFKKVPNADTQVRAYGPCEFLWLIDNADYVITNSFHGTVMSLLLKKRVLAYKHSSRNSRLESLLNMLELEEVQVSDLRGVKAIEWDTVLEKENRIESILSKERTDSENYLRRVLLVDGEKQKWR